MIRIYNQNGLLFIGEKELTLEPLKRPLQIGVNKEGKVGLMNIIGVPDEIDFVGSFSNWEVKDEGLIKAYKESVTGLTLV